MKNLVHELAGLEVICAALDVNKPSWSEHPFFVEDETDAPTTALDRLSAMPALRLRGRRLLRAVDTRETLVTQAVASEALEGLFFGNVRRLAEGFQQRLRAFVDGANRMVPLRHFSLAEGIGQTLTEAQGSLLDGSRAATTFGSPARREFENVGH